MSEGNPPKLTIGDIAAPAKAPSKNPDAKTSVELSHAKAMNKLQRADLQQNIEERKAYADKLFTLISLWLVAVFVLLLMVGFGTGGFKLSDTVVVTILSGTTVNILGLFAIVVNYLFLKPTDQQPSRRKPAHRGPDEE